MSISLTAPNTSDIMDQIVRACDKAKGDKPEKYWKRNYRRLAGHHEGDVSAIVARPSGHRLDRGKGHRKAQAAIFNVSHRRHLKWLSQLVAAARNFQAIAANNNTRDNKRAAGATAMLKSRVAEHGGQDLRAWYQTGANVRCCDMAVMMVEGDPTIYRPLKPTDEGKISRGDVIAKDFSAYDLAWFPGCPVPKSPGVVTIERFTRPEIERRWGFPKNPIEAKWPANSHMEDMEKGIGDSLYRVRRLWILPCKDFPQGAQRIEIGTGEIRKTYLSDAKIEAKYGKVPEKKRGKRHEWIGTRDNKHPFVLFRSVPLNEATSGRGAMQITNTPQYILNYCSTKILNVLRETAGATLVCPTTVADKIKALPGVLKIPFDRFGQNVIEWLAQPDLQGYVALAQFCIGILDDMFGQPAESRGQTKSGRQSGKALERAEQFAAETSSPEVLLFQIASAEVQMRILLEGQIAWPDDFVFNAIGDNKQLEARLFQRADLASVVDVRMAPDDPMPKDKATRYKWAVERFKTGGYGNPEDPHSMKRMNDDLGFPTDDPVLKQEQVQSQLILEEQEELRKGEVPVNFSDDDEQHSRMHLELLAEDMAQGGIDRPEYPQNVTTHVAMLHAFNAQRKQQLSEMGMAAGIPQAQIGMGDIEAEQQSLIDLKAEAEQAQMAAQQAAQQAHEEGELAEAMKQEVARDAQELTTAGRPEGET